MNGSRRYLTRLAALTAAAVSILAAASCSSAASPGESSSPAGTGPASGGTLKLTVGQPNPSAGNSDYYWALERGIFTRLGLDVSTVTQGAVETTNLSTGQMVVGLFGTTGMFSAVDSGRHMNIVFDENTGASTGAIFVKASSPYKTIMSLSGQKIASIGTNGAGYGAAASYSRYIVAHGGKPLTIVVEASGPALLAALQSGQVAAATNQEVFGAQVSKGLLRHVIGASNPLAERIVGQDIAAASYFGLASTLAANKTAITRFVAGLRIANLQIDKASNGQIASVLAKNPSFAPSVISTADLEAEIAAQRPFFARDDGRITSGLWSKSLTAFKNWGLSLNGSSINLTDSKFSYGNTVDISYWNAAAPLVSSYIKKYGADG
jgi:ABC-type nitrate/sulfonate/bicarbonate transport system substrate-binding protein